MRGTVTDVQRDCFSWGRCCTYRWKENDRQWGWTSRLNTVMADKDTHYKDYPITCPNDNLLSFASYLERSLSFSLISISRQWFYSQNQITLVVTSVRTLRCLSDRITTKIMHRIQASRTFKTDKVRKVQTYHRMWVPQVPSSSIANAEHLCHCRWAGRFARTIR
jgi:hypothetical protein